MAPLPRVSVIIATYNRSNVLRYAIESVLWQTFADFELLVIGDGCTDDSSEVVAAFDDPRLRWHNLPENSGHQSAPNNAGLARARGEFVAYLGHDDLWSPTHLESLVRALDEESADVAYSRLVMIWPPETGLRELFGFTLSGRFEVDSLVPPSAMMHRRSVWQEIGGWADYRSTPLAPDPEFFQRAFSAGKNFVSVPFLSAFKFLASARPDCYVDQPCHEQAEYVRRIKSEPDFLVGEWTALVESSLRRHPEDIPRAKLLTDEMPGEAIQRSRVVRGVALPEIAAPRFPEMPVGKLRFATLETEAFLWHGWSHPERQFRWSDGREAALTFSWATGQGVEIVLEMAPFLGGGKLQMQVVEILLNGQQVCELQITRAEVGVHRIPLPTAALRAQNTLLFKLPRATSPISLGISTDVRRLAIRLHAVEFIRNSETTSSA